MGKKTLFRFLMLVICVLTLCGCTPQLNPDASNTSAQSTENDTRSQENTKTALNWNAVTMRQTLDAQALEPKIRQLTYDSCKELVDNALQKHGDCDEQVCYFDAEENADVCRFVKSLKSINYPEEFFSNNSLLLITFWNSNDHPFEVIDVTYDGNILTCIMDRYNEPPNDVLTNNSGYYWSVFVEVDTVLSQETLLRVETNNVILESDEFAEKMNIFYEKYVK